ncbi:MAG: class I SAM-dependent methyltransferase [Candidatus Omnitrophota bacterium]
MTTLVSVPCDLCGQDKIIPLFKDGGFQYVRCSACELMYLNPRPTEEMLMRWYEQHGSTSEPFQLQARQKNYYQRYIENKEGYLQEGGRFLQRIQSVEIGRGRLLDVGCAAGFYLSVFKNAGWEACGLELSEFFVNYALQTLHVNVQRTGVIDAVLQDQFFDAVLAIDVLSHFASPRKVLEKIYRILKEGGVLLLRTGNKGALLRKEDGERWGETWGAPEHLYHFSEKTLKRLLKEVGFRIQVFQTYANVENVISPESLHLPEAVYRFHKVLRRPYRLLKALLTRTAGRWLRNTNLSGTIFVLATKVAEK